MNCYMPSSTEEYPDVQSELVKRYLHSANTGESAKDAIIKFFDPCGAATWYISEAMPLDEEGEPTDIVNAKDWHMYGFCNLGNPSMAEYGYVLLSQLQSVKGPLGLGIERDNWFTPKPLKECRGA